MGMSIVFFSGGADSRGHMTDGFISYVHKVRTQQLYFLQWFGDYEDLLLTTIRQI